jgi:hypothetical protein
MPTDTLEELEAEARKKYEEDLAKRAEAVASLEALIDVAVKEERTLAPEEEQTRKSLTADIEAIDFRLQAKLDNDERTKKAADFRERAGIGGGGTNNPGGGLHVGAEPHTYERDNGESYWMDTFKMGCGPGVCQDFYAAQERLKRHAKEIAVDAEALQGSKIYGSRTMRDSKSMDRYFLRQVVEAINPRLQGRDASSGTFQRDLSTAAGSGGKFLAAA